LVAGATVTLTFQAKVPAALSIPTTYTNTVKVVSTSPLDTNPLNDVASVMTTVTPKKSENGGNG
jgi:hypothetical protein